MAFSTRSSAFWGTFVVMVKWTGLYIVGKLKLHDDWPKMVEQESLAIGYTVKTFDVYDYWWSLNDIKRYWWWKPEYSLLNLDDYCWYNLQPRITTSDSQQAECLSKNKNHCLYCWETPKLMMPSVMIMLPSVFCSSNAACCLVLLVLLLVGLVFNKEQLSPRWRGVA